MDALPHLDITCMQVYKDTHDIYYICTDPTTVLLLHVCMHTKITPLKVLMYVATQSTVNIYIFIQIKKLIYMKIVITICTV